MNKTEIKRPVILLEMPEGWKINKGATTAPKGSVWVYNGQSYFKKDNNGDYQCNDERKQALLIIDMDLFKTSKQYNKFVLGGY